MGYLYLGEVYTKYKKGGKIIRTFKRNINTSFFHIISQGINKEYIFDSQENKQKYMKIIEETKEKIDTTILAYCIMGNHIHMLFYEKDVNQLTKFMHRVNLIYAKYYNKKNDRVGYVFRDRYKLQPILSEKYLYSCVKYIHNNPVKANICEKPEDYEYSSFRRNRFYTNTEIERNVRKFIVMKDFQENEEQEFVFLEVGTDKEQLVKEILQKTMEENHITKEELKNNVELLRKIVKNLNVNYHLSFRKIEELVGVGRETLRKIVQ